MKAQTATLTARTPRQIHLFTGISVIFSITAAFLLPSEYSFIGAVYSVAAYFCAMKEVSKYTSAFQFLAVITASLLTGYIIDPGRHTFPLLTFSMLLSAAGSIARIMFFRHFGYTGKAWFEPLMLILTLAAYITGNVMMDGGWQSWTFPALLILFQSILAWGIFKDKRQLLGFTKGGYKIALGEAAPEFTLPDQDENPVSLSDFRGARHLLLIFVRGDWCPGCHMMLRTYERERKRFQEKNILVMAIGPDPVGVNREMVEKLDLDFKVLADEGQRTAMRYGVQLAEFDHDFAESYEEGIPLPASFLIDKEGKVRYVSRPDKVGEFLDPRTIFPIVEKLN